MLGVPADAGYAAAQYMMGLAAEARPDEAANAFMWYRKAAEAGAEFRLGYALPLGELGLARDDAEAVRWYRLAAAWRVKFAAKL